MLKADYSKIAPSYDHGRWLSDKNIEMWISLISRYAKAPAGARLLDLGCGTGRFAIPLAEKTGYIVTGADNSPEMLEKAREKDRQNKISWVIQDAHQLSYATASFDIILMSHVLHHCSNQLQVLKECYRILKKDGVLLLRHCVIEEIRQDPESVFFPEDLAINEARIATLKKIKELLHEAGFIKIKSKKLIQRSSETSQILYERFLQKGISALAMIPQEAYERGLKKLFDYIQKHPDDPWLLDEQLRITAAYKP